MSAAGHWIDFKLSDQPEYVASLLAARNHLRRPFLPTGVFENLVLSSETVIAAQNALDEGENLSGASIASTYIDPGLEKYLFIDADTVHD